MNISQEECRRLFDLFDENDDGCLDFDELIRAIKGVMSPFRKDIVKRAFTKLDANQNKVIELDDVRQFYNARFHPDVKSGKKTEAAVT